MNTILVIEDNENIRDNILEILETESYIGIGAKNSEIGFELAKKNTPDLIICSVRIPVIDCHEFLGKLKLLNTTSKIPYAFIASNCQQAYIQEGLNLGAAGYLIKPFEADELINLIKNVLM